MLERIIISTIFLTALASAQPALALRNLEAGDKAPPFRVKSLDGETIENARTKGKVLLLIFARPEQEKSLEALKTAQRFHKAHSGSRLIVLAISSKPGAAEYFKKLSADSGLEFPIALDPERKMYGDFGLMVTPTTLLIDSTGVLRFELAHMPPDYERKLGIHLDLLLDKITREEHDALLAGPNRIRSKERESLHTRLAFVHTLIDRKQFELALPVLKKLVSQDKDSIETAVLLGTVYLELGQIDEAAVCLDRLVDHAPPTPELKLALGRLEKRRKNLDRAEAHLLEALKLSRRKCVILYELGVLYERKDMPDRALDCYRQALEEILDQN